jgi:hypothetical protein
MTKRKIFKDSSKISYSNFWVTCVLIRTSLVWRAVPDCSGYNPLARMSNYQINKIYADISILF